MYEKFNMLISIKFNLSVLLVFTLTLLSAQEEEYGTIIFDGMIYKTMIIGQDTLILANLDEVTIKPTRKMTDEELKTYNLYKRCARVAYPYAKDAINILNKLDQRTSNMTSAKRKKYIDMTYKQLESNFKTQLKRLSKTQGMIMIKMIERETNKSFYNVIKENRSGFTAFYWHQLGKFYNYNLKQGYVKGENQILDLVLKDYYFKPEDSPVLNTKIIKYEQKK